MDSKPIQALIVLVTLYLIMSVDNSGKWVKIINDKDVARKMEIEILSQRCINPGHLLANQKQESEKENRKKETEKRTRKRN